MEANSSNGVEDVCGEIFLPVLPCANVLHRHKARWYNLATVDRDGSALGGILPDHLCAFEPYRSDPTKGPPTPKRSAAADADWWWQCANAAPF